MSKKTIHHLPTLPDASIDEKLTKKIPARIGPYKIESLLNKGGMSLLYLAIDPKTTKPVVIKVLSPKYLKNKEIASRFLKEAKIIGMTDHPNIVKLYDQGQWEKGLYISMEFIRGISLKQFILQKSLSHTKALQIILQVGYALCHLHTHGVIHRDLKPENILICEDGQIKVIDFGIAQLDQELSNERITQKKRVMGTPIYMSPEQKEDPVNVSYASDIYSLGIITYELFLGRLSHGVIHLALLPKKLRGIIEKALKIAPEGRYLDIVDFISDISGYIKNSEEDESSDAEEPEEMAQILFNAQKLCQPKAFENSQLEIGIKCQEGLFFSGLYYDFFKVNNKLIFFLAEPKKTGIISMVHTSIFRGMVRMVMHEMKNTDTVSSILPKLNQALIDDPMDDVFSVTLVLLDPEKDSLSLFLLQSLPLIHLPFGKDSPNLLQNPNPYLGKEENVSFIETTDNWHAQDILSLCSKGFLEDQDLSSVIVNNRHNSSKHLSELLFEKAKRNKNRPLFALTVKRVF